jgi:hypothetical protein
MEEVTLLHRLADVVGNRVASAKSLGGEIAYANRPHTGHTRNRAVGIRYLTCDQSGVLLVVTDNSVTKLRVVTG